ncbi:MAG: hypothetical protein H7Y07_04805 [Pyrinomonadaceae bacterium]|nr:hypothetical protein [Sphingobacteriaceae bacterium]
MNLFIKKSTLAFALGLTSFSATIITSCSNDDKVEEKKVELKNHSATPVLLKTMPGFTNLELFSLISSDDVLSESPGFIFGGSADGSGIVKNPNGKGFYMMVNHEDNYSVSRITLDETFKPVKGEYALNSDAGQWRLCSGTMATPEEHGFGPFYLSVGESDAEAMTHKIDPIVSVYDKYQSKAIAGLGRWSGENAVPLHKDAYSGKTVIITGEDASDASGGQVVLYLSNTVGDLDNGTQYMLRRKDLNQKERDMVAGTSYDVEFVKIDNHKTLTGAQMQALVDPAKAIKFGRVEDIDYRKGSGAAAREVYFTVTGQDATGANADNSRTVKGRVYKMVLDAANPLIGKLECILDGDVTSGPASQFQNPDNICVTSNYAYIQEDPNTYGNETHDAYLYQYNLATKEFKVVFELDHRRTDASFHPIASETAAKGNWEYGALIDVSDLVGIPNTFYMAIQPHTWKLEKFKKADGGAKRPNEMQGSQIVVIKGLPR